jgi:RNA polymerase sigma factor (sigma-70 family)
MVAARTQDFDYQPPASALDTVGLGGEASDSALLERWRVGDQNAGRDLFARYFDQLRRFFANKCNEPDEMVQLTFMALLKAARTQFAGRSSFRTYVFTIARHELYRHIRNLRRNDKFDPVVSSIANISTTIGAKLARNQEHRALCAALRTLPLEQQTILELHYWDDIEAPQLAEIFEIEPAAMRMRLSRARAALREAMLAGKAAPPEALANEETLDTWARKAR